MNRAAWLAFVESNTTGTGREFCVVARARGLRPVLLTNDPTRYGYLTEDDVEHRVLDTGDPTAIHAACAALDAAGGLAGVTSSSEYFVSAAARAAAAFGLPAAAGDAIDRCRAKDVQRGLLAAGGVRVPEFRVVADPAAAARAAEEIGCPVVVKPVAGSGSVGVRLCRDGAETHEWARHLLARSADERGRPMPRRVLVESAVVGPEYSVETLDGTVVAVTAKHLGPEPYFVETGHDVPAPCPGAVPATATAALAALGLGWGAAHTELRWTEDGPVVIEVNPRLAGGMIPVAVRAATGVDMIDAVVARACGQSAAPVRPATGPAAVRFLVADRDGHVARLDGLAAAATAPGVVAVAPTTAVGRTVRVTNSFQDRLVGVVASGADPATAATRAQAALRLIRIDIEDATVPPGPRAGRAHQAREEGVGRR